MDPIFDQVIDGLSARGALRPTPGSDAAEVRMFHTAAPAISAAPMVRFHRVIMAFRAQNADKAESHRSSQGFVDWQHRFFSLGLQIYMPPQVFLPWMKATLPVLVQNPLPESFKELIQDQVEKITAPDRGKRVDSFPLSNSRATNEQPRKVAAKENKGDLARVKPIVHQHPQLLVATALFHGMHLQFLENLMTRIEQRDSLDRRERTIFSEAIERLAINFEHANFVRAPIWAAIAYDRRVKTPVEPAKSILPEDFAAGWKMMEEGGGFSTTLQSDQNSSIVRCPYHGLGNRLAAAELCSHETGETTREIVAPNSLASGSAYGLWCIYNLLRHTSSPIHGPHQEDLAAIADAMVVPRLEEHAYFSAARPKTRQFNQRILDAHVRILECTS